MGDESSKPEMRCPGCGNEIADDSISCDVCGEKVVNGLEGEPSMEGEEESMRGPDREEEPQPMPATPYDEENFDEETESPPEKERLRSDLDDLKKKVNRMKLFKRIKLVIYIILIVGVIVHSYYVYQAAKGVDISDKKITNIKPVGPPTKYEVKFKITFDNPKGTTIEAKELTYRVFVEGQYLGEGFKRHVEIKSGESSETFTFTFDLGDMSEPIQRIFLKDEVDFTVKGEVTIPTKVFGLFTWKEFSTSYSTSDSYNVSQTTQDALDDSISPLP